MRRSICVCSPNAALAGESSLWSFSYTSSSALPKGSKILFDLVSLGRPFDWMIPSCDLKQKENLIWAEMKGATIAAKKAEEMPFSLGRFEFLLPSDLKIGETFTIHMGGSSSDKGNRCQTNVQRKRPFHLYIDPKGTGEYKEPEVFYLDVRGNNLTQIRVLSPSLVTRNKRFDVVVRFEDEYGNLTSKAPEKTLIELSYEHLRENLNWKLFVPESGFLTLPNLYFNEPGVYKIQLKDLTSKKQYFSYPIKCYPEGDFSLFWGMLHGESMRFDAVEQLESCLRFFRDNRAFQFYGLSPFEEEKETSSDQWKNMNTQVVELNEDERFSVFLGFQYVGEVGEEGIRQIVYAKDSRPISRRKDGKTSGLKKIYKMFPAKELLAIPSFTMGGEYFYDFKNFDTQAERVVEIYNSWGCSECSEEEGNLRPIRGKGKASIQENPKGSLRKALGEGCRFGFIAGGLDDRGIYKDLYELDQKQYSPGLTAVFAKDHTRSSLFEALQARRCYATTGPRMVIDFSIAQEMMGSELDNRKKPGLDFNRHIQGHIIASSDIREVQILRNGKLLKSFLPGKVDFHFTYDDQSPLEEILIQGKREIPFVYYYLRIIQEDENLGWSSPIWIDFYPKKGKIQKILG